MDSNAFGIIETYSNTISMAMQNISHSTMDGTHVLYQMYLIKLQIICKFIFETPVATVITLLRLGQKVCDFERGEEGCGRGSDSGLGRGSGSSLGRGSCRGGSVYFTVCFCCVFSISIFWIF